MVRSYRFKTQPTPMGVNRGLHTSPFTLEESHHTMVGHEGEITPRYFPRPERLQMAGLAVHLDHDDGTNLEEIPDFSGHGNHISEHDNQSNQPRYMTHGLRNLPVFRFDGRNNRMRIDEDEFGQYEMPYHIFIVFRLRNLPLRNTETQWIIGDRHNGCRFGIESNNIGDHLNEVEWRMDANSSIQGGDADERICVASLLFYRRNSRARINGIQVLAGDLGDRDFRGFTLCENADASVDILGYLFYDDDMSDWEQNIESQLDSFVEVLE